MKDYPPILANPDRVRQAVESARNYAQERGISMTVERLAVCLGIPSREILDFALSERQPDGIYKESYMLLKMACEEIAASHIEHGMTRGNNPSMDILMLKSNLNYRDREEPPQTTTVVFIGEDMLPD